MLNSNRHAGLLRTDDTLLVVVDMQEPFLRSIWEREKLTANVTTLIRAANILRVPIVPTLQYASRMGDLAPEISKYIPKDRGAFDKMTFSCACDEAFLSELQRSGRKQVLLCGLETHICVNQTALDLVARDFQVVVAADAVSSRTEGNYQIGLNRMEHAGVIISSTEMAIYEMLYEAGTPDFREILSLIK